jgi:hypothetical protein
MPRDSEADAPINALSVAANLAAELEAGGWEYAFGGAIALGYWGTPRGTVDVDLTLYVSPERPSECARLLGDLGCQFAAAQLTQSLSEHGFASVLYAGIRLDVFLPTIPFYEEARLRRKRVEFAGRPMMVWDAESLAVFKMMFFRRKDVADVEQMLRARAAEFDRPWVRKQLAAMYGPGNPRLSAWDELTREVP